MRLFLILIGFIVFIGTSSAQLEGVNFTSFSSSALSAKFEERINSNLELNRNFGFEMGLLSKFDKNNNLYLEYNFGLDSYSFNLKPNGTIRSFFMFYLGISAGYEKKWSLTKDAYLSTSAGVSLLHFRGARSIISDIGRDNSISSTVFLGNSFPIVVSPRINIDYNWETEYLKGFRLGIYAATSFQDILRGDFEILDNTEQFSGNFSKKHEIIGIRLGVNISQDRRQIIRDRKSRGLLKDPKPINNTISILTYSVNIGTGSKIFISNPNTFAAEKPEKVNLNLTYGIDISRSIPILDKYHALLAFSYFANESQLRTVYREPNTDELITINTRLNRVHILSGGLGYNFLKNKKNKPNFFQLATIINLNVNLLENYTQEVLNPIDGTPLWNITSTHEGRVFFSSKIAFDHFRKLNKNRYLRLGVSLERGSYLMVGELRNDADAFSEFFQNNFAIRFHVGVLLMSESNRI